MVAPYPRPSPSPSRSTTGGTYPSTTTCGTSWRSSTSTRWWSTAARPTRSSMRSSSPAASSGEEGAPHHGKVGRGTHTTQQRASPAPPPDPTGSFWRHRWQFRSEGADVGFGVYLKTKIGERQRAGEMTEVYPNQRYNSHMVPEDGSLTCSTPGICERVPLPPGALGGTPPWVLPHLPDTHPLRPIFPQMSCASTTPTATSTPRR